MGRTPSSGGGRTGQPDRVPLRRNRKAGGHHNAGRGNREIRRFGHSTGYRSSGHRMVRPSPQAGKNRRYRPEDEESWLAQTPLNHAVYMQERGYDTCGRTAWQKQGAERLAGITRAWRRGDRWANTATRGINRAALTGHEVWSKTRGAGNVLPVRCPRPDNQRTAAGRRWPGAGRTLPLYGQ